MLACSHVLYVKSAWCFCDVELRALDHWIGALFSHLPSMSSCGGEIFNPRQNTTSKALFLALCPCPCPCPQHLLLLLPLPSTPINHYTIQCNVSTWAFSADEFETNERWAHDTAPSIHDPSLLHFVLRSPYLHIRV